MYVNVLRLIKHLLCSVRFTCCVLFSGLKENICEICGKRFLLRQCLNVHVRSHTLPKQYPCSLCGNLYKTRTTLLTHMKIHRNQRDFTCQECGRSFIQKKTYLDHLEIHTNNSMKRKALFKAPTHFCQICSKGFADSVGLKRHLQKHERGQLKCFTKFKQQVNTRPTDNTPVNNSVDSNENISVYKQTNIHEFEGMETTSQRTDYHGNRVEPVLDSMEGLDWRKCFIRFNQSTEVMSGHDQQPSDSGVIDCTICNKN